MKTIYQVRNNWRANESTIFESESREETETFFNKEAQRLAQDTPADITGWYDNNLAWGTVFCLEFEKIIIDDDGEIVDYETLATTDYYYV